MNKIKIIDLLNMISKGEEVPKKIKYKMHSYIYDGYDNEYQRYDNKDGCTYTLGEDWKLDTTLNEEVEILEEEKKIPEKLNIEDDGNTITLFGEKENEWTILDNVDVIICNKINSVIDYLKSKGDE